jgi:hypothetical protein
VEFSIKFNFENSSIKFAMLIDRRQTQWIKINERNV